MTAVELPADAPAQRFAASRVRILCILFFFSGFPALIYQLTWQRSLFRIFGVNSESVTIIVTAFMLGLGLGSLCGGWISRRTNVKPLLLLGVIELATAAFGLASLQIFERVGAMVADLPLPALAAINLVLVLLPTLLMGATLPILSGTHDGRDWRRRRHTLFCQYARRRCRVPRMRHSDFPFSRHA